MLSRKGSNYPSLTIVVTFSLLSDALITLKNDVELTQRALTRKKPLKHTKNQKRGTFGVFLARKPLFWTRKLRFWNCVSEFSGGRHIRKNSKTYPKSNFGWYGPPTYRNLVMSKNKEAEEESDKWYNFINICRGGDKEWISMTLLNSFVILMLYSSRRCEYGYLSIGGV